MNCETSMSLAILFSIILTVKKSREIKEIEGFHHSSTALLNFWMCVL
jgi:hypothetical protein